MNVKPKRSACSWASRRATLTERLTPPTTSSRLPVNRCPGESAMGQGLASATPPSDQFNTGMAKPSMQIRIGISVRENSRRA